MAPKSKTTEDIAAAVALALAKSTSDAATEVARAAAAAATEVAKTAAATALVVGTVSQDVTYIKAALGDLDKKFGELKTIFASREEHSALQKSSEEVRLKLSTLEQRFWIAQGGFAVLLFVLKFLVQI